MQKLQIIIDVEINDEGLTEQAIERAWGEYTGYSELLSDPGHQANIRRQKIFVDYLLDNPDLLKKYFKILALSSVAELDNNDLKAHTGVDSDMDTMLNFLIQTANGLSDMDRHYFQTFDADHPDNADSHHYSERVKMNAELMRKTELVAASFNTQIMKISVLESSQNLTA